MDWMPQAIREGIMVVLIISGPLVIAAAVIGLVVGILQAATQVQEQTIGTAVKIIALFGLIMLSSFWMFQYLNQYMARTLNTAFTFVPRRNQKVLSANDDLMGISSGPSFESRLKVIEPEQLENKLPGGGAPPGVLLGSPKVPKAPIYRGSSPNIPSNIPLPANETPRLYEPEESLKLIPQKLNTNLINDEQMTDENMD